MEPTSPAEAEDAFDADEDFSNPLAATSLAKAAHQYGLSNIGMSTSDAEQRFMDVEDLGGSTFEVEDSIDMDESAGLKAGLLAQGGGMGAEWPPWPDRSLGFPPTSH